MSDTSRWRFQRPDGTWVRWNTDSQTWEREDGTDVLEGEVAPDPETPELVSDEVEPAGVAPEADLDDDSARSASFSSTPEVIGWDEPRGWFLPALLIGAIIGIAAGVALLLYYR